MKNKLRFAMNFYTGFNLVNIILSIVFELLRPYYGANAFMGAIGNGLFFLVSAYSFIAVLGFVFSLLGAVYYFIGCLKWEDRSSAYLFLMITMINIVTIGYFILRATGV